MLESLLAFDRWLFLVLNRDIANPVFDLLFPFITNGRNWLIPALLASALFVWRKKRQALVVIALAILTVAITDPLTFRVLKPLFGRSRPCMHPDELEGIRMLIGVYRSLSFPSNHAANIFGQAALFTCFYPRRWYWYFTLAAAIGFSRVYVGVHWPLDVICGAAVGAGVGYGVFWTYVALQRRIGGNRRSGAWPERGAAD